MCLLWPSIAQAAFSYADDSWEGMSEFLALARRELGAERVVIRATLDWSELKPEDGVILMHPEGSVDYVEVSAYLRAGGRLALLDDRGRGDELLARFHITRVPAPLRPAEMLRNTPGFAVAVPAVHQVAGEEQARHPVVAHVDKLITNYPTALTHENLNPVLEIPAIGEPSATLATTGIIAKRGRLFAMGDPSAVMNLMLRYPGNRAFAAGLVRYLVDEDDWGRRGGKLYLLANDFRERGVFGGRDSWSARLRDRLQGLQDIFNETRTGGLPRLLALGLAGLAALAASGWSVRTLAKGYRRPAPRYAQAPLAVAQGGVAGRAAVLSADTTHPALSLIELKCALQDKLSLLLGFSGPVMLGNLVDEVERRKALSQTSLGELRSMIKVFQQAEASISISQPKRIAASDVQKSHAAVFALLEEAQARLAESE